MAGCREENQWKDWLKQKFPDHFKGVRVLDIGSADINGTNKGWFENCEYIGIDILPYKNVNVVTVAHEYKAPPASFDVVCSTSEFEHDMYWDKTLLKMVELLKHGGLMWFSAGHKQEEHGTRFKNPTDSLTTQLIETSWPDYYGNISVEMVEKVINLNEIFIKFDIGYYGFLSQPDLFIKFWGIKK